MPKRIVWLRILIFSLCIIVATILLMVPRQKQHHQSHSDIIAHERYGFPLAWRTHTPVSPTEAQPQTEPEDENTIDSQKLILDILIYGAVMTVLLLASANLEKKV